MLAGLLPSEHVAETRFQPAGTVSATSYVPGSSALNVSESLPAAPAAVVVRVNGDGVSVPDVKSKEPVPSLVTFSTMMVARALLVYVQSNRSAALSMSNVTVVPAITGVTPTLAEQSSVSKSQPLGSVSSVTV